MAQAGVMEGGVRGDVRGCRRGNACMRAAQCLVIGRLACLRLNRRRRGRDRLRLRALWRLRLARGCLSRVPLGSSLVSPAPPLASIVRRLLLLVDGQQPLVLGLALRVESRVLGLPRLRRLLRQGRLRRRRQHGRSAKRGGRTSVPAWTAPKKDEGGRSRSAEEDPL